MGSPRALALKQGARFFSIPFSSNRFPTPLFPPGDRGHHQDPFSRFSRKQWSRRRKTFFADGLCKSLRPLVVEVNLIDARVLPYLAGCFGDALTPIVHGGFFCCCVLPGAAFCFENPIYVAFGRCLNGRPIGVIETDGAARLEIVDA